MKQFLLTKLGLGSPPKPEYDFMSVFHVSGNTTTHVVLLYSMTLLVTFAISYLCYRVYKKKFSNRQVFQALIEWKDPNLARNFASLSRLLPITDDVRLFSMSAREYNAISRRRLRYCRQSTMPSLPEVYDNTLEVGEPSPRIEGSRRTPSILEKVNETTNDLPFNENVQQTRSLTPEQIKRYMKYSPPPQKRRRA